MKVNTMMNIVDANNVNQIYPIYFIKYVKDAVVIYVKFVVNI